jgi:hypothetical protein
MDTFASENTEDTSSDSDSFVAGAGDLEDFYECASTLRRGFLVQFRPHYNTNITRIHSEPTIAIIIFFAFTISFCFPEDVQYLAEATLALRRCHDLDEPLLKVSIRLRHVLYGLSRTWI